MVKFGQNKNKIDNIKIIINLVTELKSYMKRYIGSTNNPLIDTFLGSHHLSTLLMLY